MQQGIIPPPVRGSGCRLVLVLDVLVVGNTVSREVGPICCTVKATISDFDLWASGGLKATSGFWF